MTKESGISKREARRQQMKRSQQRNRLIVAGVIVVAVLVVAVLLIASNLPMSAEDRALIKTPSVTYTRTQVDGNSVGDPNAPLKLEEFSDFQCPYCDRFSIETEEMLLQTYVETGKLYFTYRSFGAFIGPESGSAAEAAYCAGDQGKFWEMHDIIFANQTGENVGDYPNKRLTAFAELLNLDMNTFTKCFNGGIYSSRVDQDLKDGRAAGVQATPSFVLSYTVNGQPKTVLIQGAIPFDNASAEQDFKRTIEAALAEADQ